MDAHLQDPLELISEMLQRYAEASTWCTRFADSGTARAGSSVPAPALLSQVEAPGGCRRPHDREAFRLMSRRAVLVLQEPRDAHRFVTAPGGMRRLSADRHALRSQRTLRGRHALSVHEMLPFASDGFVCFLRCRCAARRCPAHTRGWPRWRSRSGWCLLENDHGAAATQLARDALEQRARSFGRMWCNTPDSTTRSNALWGCRSRSRNRCRARAAPEPLTRLPSPAKKVQEMKLLEYNDLLASLDRRRYCRGGEGYAAWARDAGLSVRSQCSAGSHATRGLVDYFILELAR
jgi:hypothetical protein